MSGNYISRRESAPKNMEIIPFYDPRYESADLTQFSAKPLVHTGLFRLIDPCLKEIVRQNLFLNRSIDRFAEDNNIDALFFTSHLDVPATLKTRYIVMAHDMIQSALAEKYYGSIKERLNVRMQIKALKNAEKIIAVSEHTRDDVAKYSGVDPSKIEVVYNGVSDCFKVVDNPKITRFDLPEKFVLNVGGIDWRKNVEVMFSAFSKLLETDKSWHLVMTGDIEGDDRYRAFMAKLAKSGLAGNVMALGYVSTEELVMLYNMAQIFFYPSLYEGFGLPVLEAMKCGTPVISSRSSSIPEVAGSAALLIGSDDEKGFADGLVEMATNRQRRDEMISAGLEQAKKFSWDKSAEKLFGIIAG